MVIDLDVVFSLIIFVISLATFLFSVLILIVLYKHRVDRAPLLSFFLKKGRAIRQMNLFIYPAVFILVFGLSLLFLPSFKVSEPLGGIISYFPYIFGGLSILFIAFINYRWFGWFRRFAR